MVTRLAGRTSRGAALLAAIALGLASACAPGGANEGGASGGAPAETGADAGEPAATVDGETITVGELDAWIKERLFEQATDEGEPAKLHEVRSRALDDLIRQRLVEREAEAEGTTAEALLQAQQEEAGAVSDEDVRAFYDQHAEQMGGVAFEDVAPRIRSHLEERAGPDAARRYARELRERADVTVHLDAPRVDVAATGPSRGPEDAPVTVVEFSDYECPYCRRVEPTLEELRERYPERVRFVYRHFPLERVHSKARRAAEAAECAEEQDRFWEYHETLFDRAPELGPEKLEAYAEEVGLDMEDFRSCLEEGRFSEEVETDLAAGREAGVTGTPAFFVNGIPLSGAQPLEEFVTVIEGELERLGAASEEPAAG